MERLSIFQVMRVRSFSWGGLAAALALGAVFALVVIGLAQAPANAADESVANAPDFATIDRYIETEMEATRLPGLATRYRQG